MILNIIIILKISSKVINLRFKHVCTISGKEAINTGTHQQDLIIISMCQCLICDCWWYNYCGVCCGGCHEAHLIYSWWCCKPEDLRLIDPECCHICACDGLGYNCLYYGSICCAPQAVIEWSRLRSGGGMAGGLSGKTIIINNNMPSPIYMQPMQPVGGNYQITTANANYGNGMNMNVNMNGPNMEMRTDMGGMGMNTNMNGGMGMNTNMNVGMGGMNTNMNVNGGVGMGGGVNANVNMGGNVNMNTNMNNPGLNAKISF